MKDDNSYLKIFLSNNRYISNIHHMNKVRLFIEVWRLVDQLNSLEILLGGQQMYLMMENSKIIFL